MNNIIPFDFNSQPIRAVQDNDGEPWFSLDDLCEVLGLTNPTVVASRLDADELAKFNLGRQRPSTIVSESGMYSVILRSDKPAAKEFRKWITTEVLPSIRKTGAFSVTAKQDLEPLLDSNTLFCSYLTVAREIFKGNQALLSANKATRRVTNVDVLEGMDATHLIADSKEMLLTATDIGKQIDMSGQKVNQLLEEKGLVISFRDHKNKKQYKLTKQGEPMAEVMDTGKKHRDGTPVKQIKWFTRVVEFLKGGVAA